MHRGHRPLGCVDSFFARHFVDTVFDNKKNLKKFPQIIYEQETKKQPNKKENKIKVECLFPACPWPVKDQIYVPSATKVSNGIGALMPGINLIVVFLEARAYPLPQRSPVTSCNL